MEQAKLDAQTRNQLIQALAGRIESTYVFIETADAIAAELRDRLTRGDFDSTESEQTFAALLNDSLEQANDRHLRVKWQEEPLAKADPSEDHDDSEFREYTRLLNNCIRKAERLAGNVGYLNITGFCPPNWGKDTLAAAMTFLENVSALIVDLRRCTGGNLEMVQVFCSYFLPEDTHLNTFYWREADKSVQSWTMPCVPGPRLLDVPLFVLTSQTTFSAGEDAAYTLQALGRATIIGESTGGGAHPGDTHRLSDHLEVFIPSGRAVNPVTGANWEGTGVQPNVEADAQGALDVAHVRALRTILARIEPDASPALCRIRAEARRTLDEQQPYD